MTASPAIGRSGQRHFLILGKARCGSTFLRDLLNSHPRILAFGEIFRDTTAIGWDLPRLEAERQSPALLEKMRSDPVRFLDEDVFGGQPAQLAAVGFKIFYYHAQEEPRRRIWEHLRERGERGDLRVIHLKRRNSLREFLSLRRAELTKEWYRTKEPAGEEAPLELGFEECLRFFEYACERKQHFDRFFAAAPGIELFYEELVADPERETTRVQRFLGAPVRRLRAAVVKQARLPLPRALANYAQLRERFEGTPWREFFDE